MPVCSFPHLHITCHTCILPANLAHWLPHLHFAVCCTCMLSATVAHFLALDCTCNSTLIATLVQKNRYKNIRDIRAHIHRFLSICIKKCDKTASQNYKSSQRNSICLVMIKENLESTFFHLNWTGNRKIHVPSIPIRLLIQIQYSIWKSCVLHLMAVKREHWMSRNTRQTSHCLIDIVWALVTQGLRDSNVCCSLPITRLWELEILPLLHHC